VILPSFCCWQFTYDHDDYLILVAAGNTGPDDYTVGAPATAKNILSVGSSTNSRAALLEYGNLVLLLTVISGPPGMAGQSCDIQPAAFGPAVILGGPVWTGQLVLMKPLLGCSSATNAVQLKGGMALIQRGTCEFGTKVLNAQRAGAIAAVVFDNVVNTNLLIMSAGADGRSVTIPSCFISWRNGEVLKSYLDSAAVSISFPSGETVLPGEGLETRNRLDDFSSRGPTLDQRFKPDIVCPGGNIRSALSFGSGSAARQCGAGSVVEMSGTSMATPSCAGASALVRQYFREGYHIDGIRNPSAGLNATAALVKAVMIHSGRPVYILQGGALILPQTMPDYSQGYGRVDLHSVLRFDGEPVFNLSVWNKEQVSDGGSRHYCLVVNPGATRLRVTVVWTDPPGTLGSNRILINDLDLSVITPDGAFYYGNALTQWNEVHGSHAVIDNLNNAEQVLDLKWSVLLQISKAFELHG
jgi:subtilisin family serine protease